MSVRSGRFRYTTTKDSSNNLIPLNVVHGRSSDTAYRLFNTGDETIEVTYDKGGQKVQDVASGLSIDFVINGDIKVEGPVNKEITGIYELVNQFSSGRTGKFMLGGTHPASATIAAEKTPNTYRVFNSGRAGQNITLKDGPTAITTLAAGQSVDVAAKKDLIVEPSPVSGTAEGIYQAISRDINVRNGRFRIKDATNAARQNIVNLRTGGQVDEGFYRVFNSGEHALVIWLASGPSAPFHVLPPEASWDFMADKGDEISVAGETATPTDIEGSYAFLGN